jgi:hypothetical protein
MALKFSERLDRAHAAADSLVCVGLDPDLATASRRLAQRR